MNKDGTSYLKIAEEKQLKLYPPRGFKKPNGDRLRRYKKCKSGKVAPQWESYSAYRKRIRNKRIQEQRAHYNLKIKAWRLISKKLECAICKNNDERCLEIDHIKRIGQKRKKPRELYKSIIANHDLKNLQLLCANCHKIKSVENDYIGKRNW